MVSDETFEEIFSKYFVFGTNPPDPKILVNYVNSWCMEGPIDSGKVERCLHQIWDAFIVRILGGDNINRLVVKLLQIKSHRTISPFGNQGSSSSCEEENTEFRLDNGQRLWTDLPFFADDIQHFWTHNSKALNKYNRTRLARWTSLLASVGVWPVELLRCGLWLFSEVLEVESLSDEFLKNNLAACLSWIRHNRHAIKSLSEDSVELAPRASISHAPGPLAGHITDSGFSIQRFSFWRQRFEELAESGDGDIAAAGILCSKALRNARAAPKYVFLKDRDDDEFDEDQEESLPSWSDDLDFVHYYWQRLALHDEEIDSTSSIGSDTSMAEAY